MRVCCPSNVVLPNTDVVASHETPGVPVINWRDSPNPVMDLDTMGFMLNKSFSAKLEKSPNHGGWTYVVWPDSAKFFGTKGSSKSAAVLLSQPLSRVPAINETTMNWLTFKRLLPGASRTT